MSRRPPSIPERLIRRYVARTVSRLTYGLRVLALIPLVTTIGVLIFVAVGVVVFGLYTILGEPGAPLGLAFSFGWFGGSLLILFLVLRRGHRWLARLIAIANAPAALIDPYADEQLVEARRPTAWGEAPDQPTYLERLAAADARHAPPSEPRDKRP